MYYLNSYQQEIFDSILHSNDRLFCIRAGCGSGLTHMLSMLALEYGNHVEGQCVMLSSSWTCVIKTIGGLIPKLIKEFHLPYTANFTHYTHKNDSYGIYLVAPNDTENLAFYEKKLVIVDCAGTLSKDYIDFLQNGCGMCKVVCAGVPLAGGEAFNSLFSNPWWKSYHITSKDVLDNYRPGMATSKWHSTMRASYGENSSIYKTRCLGELVA